MRRTLKEYGIVIGLAATAAFLFRFLFLEAYSIPGPAMKPTLLPGDHVLVWKLPYIFSSPIPERGDVVLFSPPEDPHHHYLRRVVGIPGDQIEISQGELIVNGSRTRAAGTPGSSDCIPETLAGRDYETCRQSPELADFPLTTVAPGTVFLVADFRTRISSAFPAAGVAPIDSLRGEAKWIWMSIQPQAEALSIPGDSGARKQFSRLRFDRIFRKVSS